MQAPEISRRLHPRSPARHAPGFAGRQAARRRRPLFLELIYVDPCLSVQIRVS
jgi:hypothetical protein